ncbi:hypothetical protein BDZ94DRAFT_1247902 [Collybia nuda]|uniref:Uncharacterized protein n=1 Tax=Collybia nuda TaxID=64659 RepID=A0A9P6CIX6_9AGAR|nr:hypothetical protein BDZ94DRAFT_1247902 [Collybia nuda]
MLTLRAYAVYHNNKLVIGLLSTIWIAHLALMIYALAKGINGGEIEIPHKTVAIFAPLSFRKNSGIIYILPAIAFDIIAGAFLTFGLYQRSGSYRAKTPLVKLIIQDGLLYFMVVFMSNLAWVLLHIFKSNDWTFSARVVEFVPLEIITTVMIGRLTLNLRMCDPTGTELTFQTMTLRFRQRASTVTL